MGRARLLCPSNSDINLFSNFEGVVDLDAVIPDSAFNLGVTEKQLNRPQVACAFVDHRGLGPP